MYISALFLLVIFYLSNLERSSAVGPVALATILNKERILSDEKLAVIKEAKGSDVETHTKLFSFVKEAANLYVYGSVLYEIFNRKLGEDILHDYGMSLTNMVVVLLITKYFRKMYS